MASSKWVREADEAKDTKAEAGAGAYGWGDAAGAGHSKEGVREVSKGSHDLSAFSFMDKRAVFLKGNISDIVEAVFDRPLAAAQAEESGGVRFLRGQAGEAICCFS